MKIGQKIFLITIGVLFVSLLASSVVIVVNFKKNYTEALIIGSSGLGQSLNSVVTELLSLGLPLESFSGMEKKCSQILKNNPYIAYVGIADITGKTLYHSDASLIGKVFNDDVMKKSIASVKPLTQRYRRFDGHDYYDITIPVIDDRNVHVGLIRLGFRTSVVTSKVVTALFHVVINFAVSFVIIAFLLNYFISRFVSRPVIRISEHARQIAEGNYNVVLKESNGDEVGALANSINQMSNQVRQKTDALEAANSELKLKLIERKEAEAELERYRDQLEVLVEERTSELLIARDDANAANRAKSMFLANMSHELRTPLNAIIGFSEVIADEKAGPVNSKQSKYINNVLTSGRHLLSLINDILDLSKVEAGMMALELTPVCIETLIEVSMLMVREKAAAHKLKLVTHYENWPKGRQIAVDERKMKQIMFNLISNAVKFTHDEGVITVTVRDAPGKMVVSVADTGIGISQDDIVRIFREFEQADSSYSRKQEGSGLGLAITRKLVELHGGRIWAESQGLGKGSMFTFEIPIADAAQPK